MHANSVNSVKVKPTVRVKYLLEDPKSLGQSQEEIELLATKGENLLELGLDNGIDIEHACGGQCACSTCHCYILEGMSQLSEAAEDEEDRVEEAPGSPPAHRIRIRGLWEKDWP